MGKPMASPSIHLSHIQLSKTGSRKSGSAAPCCPVGSAIDRNSGATAEPTGALLGLHRRGARVRDRPSTPEFRLHEGHPCTSNGRV